jgi:undecaprenyl-diphosphatase
LPPIHVVVLALLEGLSEVLPIGSSAHSVLLSAVAGWPEQSLALDLAAHLGVLAALVLYFWRDLLRVAIGFLDLLRRKERVEIRLVPPLLAGTLPLIAFGWVVERYLPPGLGGLPVVAWTMIGFALLLYFADRYELTVRRIEHMTLIQAGVIGASQLLGFFPGIGRVGAVMLTARLFACERQDAARFALLLSIPALMLASVEEALGLAAAPGAQSALAIAWSGVIAGLAAFLATAFLMRWLGQYRFGIFVLYRLLIGAGLLYLLYVRPA